MNFSHVSYTSLYNSWAGCLTTQRSLIFIKALFDFLSKWTNPFFRALNLIYRGDLEHRSLPLTHTSIHWLLLISQKPIRKLDTSKPSTETSFPVKARHQSLSLSLPGLTGVRKDKRFVLVSYVRRLSFRNYNMSTFIQCCRAQENLKNTGSITSRKWQYKLFCKHNGLKQYSHKAANGKQTG